MNISLSFAEYAAVNSIREVGSIGFELLSTAKLGKDGNNRTWVLDGAANAFESLLADVTNARRRTLSMAMNEALAGVSKAIEGSQAAT